MSSILEQAQKILESAKGNEEVEIYISSGTETEVVAYQGEIEQLSSAASSGIGIRVLLEGSAGAKIGTAWAGSLDEDAIRAALNDARDNMQFATEDEFLTFARPDGVAPVAQHLTDDGVLSTPIDEKIAMAIELEQRVRKADPRIRQVDSANYSDYVAEAAIASTFGINVAYSRSGAYLSVAAIASENGDDQSGWGLSVGRAPRELSIDVAASDAVLRSTRMLGAVKPKSQKTSVVFDPRCAATLLSIIGGALSGEAVVLGRSFFAQRLGEVVASQLFTLVDDPTDSRHFAASTYDGEGLACRKNVLIEDGMLKKFVYDTVSARRAGTVSTGNAQRGGIAGSPSAGCRALQLQPGSQSQSEILASVGEGVFVESIAGIHSGVNTISGDFSVGITGRMIRNGQFAEPIREATVTSTLQKMLLDITNIGSDVEWLPGSAAGLTLAIGGFSLSGS